MGFLKCILHALRVLGVIFAASVFTFDAEQRRFQQHGTLQTWRKVAHYLLFLPWLAFLGIMFSITYMDQLLAAIQSHFPGATTLVEAATTLVLVLAVTRYILLAYIIHLYRKREEEVEQLLNDFVSVYDQYVALFGPKLRINWFAAVIMFCKIFTMDVAFCIICMTQPNMSAAGLIYLTMSTPIICIVASLVALLLLHALFRGATLSQNNIFWQQCLDGRSTQQLLRFYDNLMQLRDSLEKCLKPFIVAQIIAETICIIAVLHYIQQFGLGMIPLIMMSLVNPCLHAWLCHDMVNAEQKMGNELLTLHCEHVDDEASKLVQLFCLQKLFKERLNHNPWRVLYLRKDFILEFIHISWINGIFLNSIAFSDSTVRMFDSKDPRLILGGQRGIASG